MDESQDTKYSLFFYGVLLHPDVLKKVIGHDGVGLKIQPAMLPGYTRHHVKGNDYPAIIPYEEAKKLFTEEPHPNERCVRGSLVTGFKKVDVELLDLFEGDEYENISVQVYPLAPSQPLSSAESGVVFEAISLQTQEQIDSVTETNVYVWSKGIETLEPQIWKYETFVKENLHKWIGAQGEANYEELVGKRNAGATATGNTEQQPQEEYVFGHGMLKYFCFDKNYINLNHGSYGSSPLPVLQALKSIEDEIEGNADLFHRFNLASRLASVRARLAKFVGAETDDVVLVQNATHGVNLALHNFTWEEGDILIGFTTTYSAVQSILRYFSEKHPKPDLSIVQLTFPTTQAAIIELFKSHLESLPKRPNNKVVAVVDGIISSPGAVLPWQELTRICRERGVWSVVDAAHNIGQLPIDLKSADPDFFVTNCHKWLYVKRSCALFYVPKRNQNMVRGTLAISFGYASPPDPVKFVEQFDWTGTMDFGPYLTIHAAMDFREKIGGEIRINEYCHRMAREGGKRMAEILGTKLLDEQNEFTANMVDVLLPFPNPIPTELQETIGMTIMKRLLEEWHCMAAIYVHDDKLWARASGQIWTEVADFEYVANALADICKDLSSGSK